MIISFEQSPESFYKLALAALDRGELRQALVYCENAVNGKGNVEYKLTLADIYLRMGRQYEAMDVALGVIASGSEGKSEAYDLMARATGVTGKLYESVYYVTEKARLDGDEDALDAMDEMMEEMASGFESEPKPKKGELFLVGKEPEKDYAEEIDRALGLMRVREYDRALEILLQVKPTSEYYPEAMDFALRCYVKKGDVETSHRLAKEAVEREPQDAFALYVLVGVCKEKEYLPLLEKVDGEASELYYAVAAADAVKEYALGRSLAAKLLRKAPYAPETYFVAAGVHYNAGERAAGEAVLKDLFSFYREYPASVILKGLKSKKRYDVMYNGMMPEAIITVLRTYVRKHAANADAFLQSMLTDADFRKCLTILFRLDDDEVVGNAVSFLGELRNKELDRFFDALLLRASLSPMTKREILAERLLAKHKGKLTVVPSALPMTISCRKPEHYAEYPVILQEAYVDALSFGACVMDVRLAKPLASYAEACYRSFPILGRVKGVELTVALFCLSMPEPDIPMPDGMTAYMTSQIFGLSKKEIARVVKLMDLIRALEPEERP
ncbi:MAG: hypothetical protein J6Y74_00050 [Clostridia bacterium]|nr:hypothetical protein [Clostridia bacterium]